jgi:glycosyltransferase involved in cell wall biosynthesis
MINISAVIPTRNRPDQMISVLSTLQNQLFLPSEIIVVDSSDDSSYRHTLIEKFSTLPITWISSAPSVCVQRNAGINRASCEWILLCDDDIELESHYLQTLATYIESNPNCGALAGRLLQKEGQRWVDQYPVKSFFDLSWRFIFQDSVWGSFDSLKISPWQKPMFSFMHNWYTKRGNTITAAGWPLITDWGNDFFCTKIYSLGANLILRNWLLKSPYDEVLDRSGIGDNYGVALGFPGHRPVHVIASTHAYHHRAEENRLARNISHYRRILALQYFLKQSGQKKIAHAWFLWSLIGKTMAYSLKGDWKMTKATLKAMGLILSDRNPYWKGHIRGKKVIQPLC